jgi:hypothetical protein
VSSPRASLGSTAHGMRVKAGEGQRRPGAKRGYIGEARSAQLVSAAAAIGVVPIEEVRDWRMVVRSGIRYL